MDFNLWIFGHLFLSPMSTERSGAGPCCAPRPVSIAAFFAALLDGMEDRYARYADFELLLLRFQDQVHFAAFLREPDLSFASPRDFHVGLEIPIIAFYVVLRKSASR